MWRHVALLAATLGVLFVFIAAGTNAASGASDAPVLVLVLLIFSIVAGTFVHRLVKNLRSLRFGLHGDGVRRTGGNSADLIITRAEIQSIDEVGKLGLLVSGGQGRQLLIPATVDRYDEVVAALSEWTEIGQDTASLRATWIRLAVFGVVVTAGLCALLLGWRPPPYVIFPLMLLGLYLTRRYKNRLAL